MSRALRLHFQGQTTWWNRPTLDMILHYFGTVLIEIEFRQTLRAILSIARAAFGEPKRGETEYERMRVCAHRLSNKMGSKYVNASNHDMSRVE